MSSKTSGPLIAIVGSVDPERTDYEPPLAQAAVVSQATKALGRELANAGCRIIVYSSDAGYVETGVVHGYIETKAAKEKSIQCRYPKGRSISFPEQASHPDLFDFRPDVHEDWEMSYYRSLRDADGILLMGGGRSTFITGVIAVAYRIPLVSIATFGGAAQKVWGSLSPDKDLITEEERNVMNPPTWNDGSAQRLVEVLLAQRNRLREEKDKEHLAEHENIARDRGKKAGLFFLIAVVLMAVGWFADSPSLALFVPCFLGAPLLAGGAGGIMSTYMSMRPDQTPRSIGAALTGGVIAGFIAAILFVLGQLATQTEIQSLAQAVQSGRLNGLTPFVLVIGFIAGFTWEAVFDKFRRADVVDLTAVTSKKP